MKMNFNAIRLQKILPLLFYAKFCQAWNFFCGKKYLLIDYVTDFVNKFTQYYSIARYHLVYEFLIC